MPHPLSLEDFNAIYARVPRLCIEVVMVEADGVVLTKRAISPGAGLWHLPGGTLRFGETLVEAARRVAREETGVEIDRLQQLGVIEYDFSNYAHWPVGIAYLARPVSGTYRCDATATEVRSCRVPDDLMEMDMIAVHRTFLLKHGDVIRTRVRAAERAAERSE